MASHIKLSAQTVSLAQIKTNLLVLGVWAASGSQNLGSRNSGSRKTPSLLRLGIQIDKKWDGYLSSLIQREEFKAGVGEARLINTLGKVGPESLLLLGLGEESKFDREILRKVVSTSLRQGNRIKAKKVSFEDFRPTDKKMSAEVKGQLFAEGVHLGNYSFDLYKTQKNDQRNEKANDPENGSRKKTVEEFQVLLESPGAKRDMERGFKTGSLYAEATNLARDWINIPAKDMTPRRMADEARKVGKLPHLSAKIYDQKAIEKMGMGCYLSVSQGSVQPPYFLHLIYKPVGLSKKKIAIVGKGVTFDSGGLSLKPAQSMETMKDDMSGAAAVVAVMRALSELKPSVEVHGIAAMAENMPSGSAVKPGDVVRTMSGKTVEILNTDAEGRLTLADAVTYALKQKPDLVVDTATLTGACVVALGELCSAILGNNQELTDRLIQCGNEAGEKIWQLPLIEEYKQDLKSSIADLKNIGGRWAGTINGALFIQEFTDPKIPWAHIDIAGASWTEKELEYCPRGGTGHIVRTLLNFILSSS